MWLRLFGKTKGSTPDELAEEMSLHIQEKAEALEEQGLSPHAALAAARRAFGNQGLLQERSFVVWQGRLLGPFWLDFKSAAKQVRRAPVFAFIAIFIIAIGIGANTAIFTALYSVTLQSLPVKEPGNLVFLELTGPRINPDGISLTPPLFEQLRHKQTSFVEIAGCTKDRVTYAVPGGSLISWSAAFVSDDFFDLLGVDPLLGRMLQKGDDVQAGKTDLWPVVLNYAFWQQHFHSDRSAIGKRISISARNGIIVGVTPPAFDGLTPGSPPAMFLPSGFLFDQTGTAAAPPLSGPAAPIVRTVGRLKSGIALVEAARELDGLNSSLVKPALDPFISGQPYLAGAKLRIRPATHGIRVLDDYRRTLVFLQALMGAALLLCSINVTAIQLARVYDRAHEFALRIALGANRRHLARQCLVESLLLALCGAILSLPISLFGARLLPGFLTRAGSAESPVLHTNWTMYAASGGFVFVVTIIVGIIPVFFAARTHPAAVLKARSVLGRPPFLVGRVLVVLQMAMAFFLICMAFFFTGSDQRFQEEQTGFHPEHVVEVTAQFQWLAKSPADIMDLYRRMLHSLRAQRGIQSASITWITPFTGDGFQMEVHNTARAAHASVVDFNQIGPGYFETLQTSLLAGREFTDEDQSRDSCILNQLAAKALFGNGNALGRHVFGHEGEEFPVHCTVVGVVQNAKYADVHQAAAPALYLPIVTASLTKGGYRNNMVFLLRSDKDADIESGYQSVLARLAPGTSYMRFLPLRTQMNQALGRDRLLCLATILFAVIAVPLCGASVLGLLEIRLRRNATDLALRIAFGAGHAHVVRSIMKESLVLFFSGAAIGLPVFFLTPAYNFRYLSTASAPRNFGSCLDSVHSRGRFDLRRRAACLESYQA